MEYKEAKKIRKQHGKNPCKHAGIETVYFYGQKVGEGCVHCGRIKESFDLVDQVKS
jgi:hypothetical protein